MLIYVDYRNFISRLANKSVTLIQQAVADVSPFIDVYYWP